MWTALPMYERRGQCATQNCTNTPAVAFDVGDVVSPYCPECARKIERMRTRVAESNREIDELEAAFGALK